MDLKPFFFIDQKKSPLFLAQLLVFILNILGYSIVFPLFQTPQSPFFSDLLENQPLIVGALIGLYGLGQLIGVLLCKKLETHFSCRFVILSTFGSFIVGQIVILVGLLNPSLEIIFLGRFLSGIGSGNIKLIFQKLHREHIFVAQNHLLTFLFSIAAMSLFLGPWIGASLGQIEVFSGGGGLLAIILLGIVDSVFLFLYLKKLPNKSSKDPFWIHLFKELIFIFVVKHHRKGIFRFILFSAGWILCLSSIPYFFSTKFGIAFKGMGDIYSFLFVTWFFGTVFLHPELSAKISNRSLIYTSIWLLAFGMFLIVFTPQLWTFWILIPVVGFCGAIAWAESFNSYKFLNLQPLEMSVIGIVFYVWGLVEALTPLIPIFYQRIDPGTGLFLSACFFFFLACLVTFYRFKLRA